MDDIGSLLDGSGGDLAEKIAIQMDTYTGRAGLEEFCRDGGSVHDVEAIIALDDYSEDAEEITGSYEVYFEEHYYRGCADMTWSNSYKGTGTLKIDTSTGLVSLETEAEQVPSAADIADRDAWDEEMAGRVAEEENASGKEEGGSPPLEIK